MKVNTIAVIGAGSVGMGIAWALAAAGKNVFLYDIKPESVEKTLSAIKQGVSRAEARGQIPPGAKDYIIGNIIGTAALDQIKNVELVIEAAVENLAIKKDIHAQLDAQLAPEIIIATNTSSLSITEIAAATNRPDKVVGMHFFSPATVMQLIEVIPALQTSQETVDVIMKFATAIGKKPIQVKEGPGFVVNRILVLGVNEACFILSEGLASVEDIDKAMKLGAGWPLGPFAWADLVGIDITVAVLNTLYTETGDPKYRAAPNLTQMVRAGWLGRKTGKGFYDYGHKEP